LALPTWAMRGGLLDSSRWRANWLARSPHCSFPQSLSQAQLKTAYRFFDNDGVIRKWTSTMPGTGCIETREYRSDGTGAVLSGNRLMKT
jgi:hypothetical protein